MNTFVRVFALSAYLTLALGLSLEEVSSPTFLANLERWWGPSDEEGKASTDIRPFSIKFADEMINDLRYRLNNRRALTPPLEGAAFEYGFNSDSMDYWMDFWANNYNFTERESYLNKYPQYKTNIQGLDVHFIRVKPDVPEGTEVLPLLLLHGWPGSVVEFYETIPLITAYSEERGFAVEVIVPSLPGFGFTDGAVRRDFGMCEIAVVMRNLMRRLGFEKFYLQGGDFGAYLGNQLVTFYPEEVLGYHSNFPLTLTPGSLMTYVMGSLSPQLQSLVVDESLAERMYPLSDTLVFLLQETGYLHMHATKPDTLGVGMSDSPMALFAWLMQFVSMSTRKSYKFRDDGGLHELYTPEMLIDNTMLYWMDNKFTTAIRIYSESFTLRTMGMGIEAVATTVPTCIIHAKDEAIFYYSPAMLKFKFTNLLRVSTLPTCGHFLALECPEIFVQDVLKALVEFRTYHEKNKTDNRNEL